MKAAKGKPAKYSVQEYLAPLDDAGRSKQTTRGYYKVFQSYAKFLGVPVDEIHYYLSVDNLLKYAHSRNGMSPAGKKTNLSVLHRYFARNGVVFDELEFNAMKPKVIKEQNDQPLSTESLRHMFDLTDPHGKAILSFLVSTGCRAGENTAKSFYRTLEGWRTGVLILILMAM